MSNESDGWGHAIGADATHAMNWSISGTQFGEFARALSQPVSHLSSESG
jgi:hypothetical protein